MLLDRLDTNNSCITCYSQKSMMDVVHLILRAVTITASFWQHVWLFLHFIKHFIRPLFEQINFSNFHKSRRNMLLLILNLCKLKTISEIISKIYVYVTSSEAKENIGLWFGLYCCVMCNVIITYAMFSVLFYQNW